MFNHDKRQGMVTIEFLMILPLIMLTITLMVATGNAMYQRITLVNALQSATFVYGATADEGQATNTVKQIFNNDTVQVKFSPSHGAIVSDPGIYIVTGQATFVTAKFPFFGTFTFNTSATAPLTYSPPPSP